MNEERLGTPAEFSRQLARHLALVDAPRVVLPSDADLALLVDVMFYASMHEEEGRRSAFNVAWQPGSSDCSALVAIQMPVPVTPKNLGGMVLFDAVDRSLAIDSTEIPRNVERVVYARRDKLAMSRNSFGNSGTVWHAPTRCDMRSFFGTHGAMGGVPTKAPPGANSADMIHEGLPERHPSNVSYAQDARAAREVWTWINPRLNSLGILGGTALAQATV